MSDKYKNSLPRIILASSKSPFILPPSLKNEPEEVAPIELIDPVIELRRNDSNYENHAVYDSSTNSLVVYLDPSYDSFHLDRSTFSSLVSLGQDNWNIDDIGFADRDESLLPTCKWFVPSAKTKNTEMPDSWPYSVGPLNHVCQCPDFTPKGKFERTNPCTAPNGSHTSCGSYAPSEPITLRSVDNPNGQHVTVTKVFLSSDRTVTYHVSSTEFETVTKSSADEAFSLFDSTKQSIESSGTPLTQSPVESQNQKYFSTVLSS